MSAPRRSGGHGPRSHVLILAGGAGERFWPRSRAGHPKPLLRLLGRESLLEATLQRARRLAPAERIWLVCGHEHAAAMRAASGLPRGRVLVEPQRRNTAMAVALGAWRVAQEDPDAVLAVLSADHHIPDARAFAADLRRAAAAAEAHGALVTLGVRPTRPETGYGYIRLGAPVGRKAPGLHRVGRFVEKPDRARARRWWRRCGHLWNAGIFAWTAPVILEEIARHAPDLDRALDPLRSARGARGRDAALAEAYRRAPSLPVDKAVLERSRRVWCLPVRWHWSDVGTWASLAGELGVAPGASVVLGGDAILREAGGNLVWADGRPLVLLGVEGLAVIDAGDAVLVSRLDRAGEVRGVVEELRARGRADLV
jgi:mannose-1-phosphate guanylyltransferase